MPRRLRRGGSLFAAGSKGKIIPNWEHIRLKNGSNVLSPTKLWSERREVLRESNIKARLIFTKPNVSKDLKGFSLIVPLKGSNKSWTLNLKGAK